MLHVFAEDIINHIRGEIEHVPKVKLVTSGVENMYRRFSDVLRRMTPKLTLFDASFIIKEKYIRTFCDDDLRCIHAINLLHNNLT